MRHLADVTQRACGTIRIVDDHPVEFQGKALTMGDFVATWVVELAVHQLDLAEFSAPVGVSVARRTVAAVAGTALPAGLSDVDAVLAGLGRTPWPVEAGDPGPFPIAL